MMLKDIHLAFIHSSRIEDDSRTGEITYAASFTPFHHETLLDYES